MEAETMRIRLCIGESGYSCRVPHTRFFPVVRSRFGREAGTGAHYRHEPMAVMLALLSAVGYAVASVLQHHAARDEPDELALRPRLLWRLLRRPQWLLGTAADIGAFGLQAVAIGLGSLVVVQPLLCTGLLFALPLSAAWQGRRLERRDWVAALALSVALAVFLVVGDPTDGKDFASTRAWIVAAAVLGPAIA